MKLVTAIKLFLLLLSISISLQWNREDTLLFASHPDLDYLPEMQARAADSLYRQGNNETGLPDRDTLFTLCAKVGYEAIEDQMQRYYEEAVDPIPEDADRREEIRRIRETVKRIGGNILQRELEYCEAIALPDNTPEKRNKKIAAFYALADRSVVRKEPFMELRALLYIFRKLYIQEQYYAAFLCAGRIVGRLETISDADYPKEKKKNIWYDIGRIYYDFGDYEYAVPYLKAALSNEPVRHFYSMFNIQARNTLGVYYREIGELDSSDYYFRSILECKDRVKLRPMLDCIALSNLATNYRRRGRYREAFELHKGALPFSLAEGDHSFTSGIYVGLADCRLEMGDLPGCKAMIDSALFHIEQWPWVMSYRSCDLYPVMARYYFRSGDQERSIAYMDSAAVVNRREDGKYSALLILRANQELFESERARKEVELESSRRRELFLEGIAGTIFVCLLILSFHYRSQRRTYRALVARSREWAEQEPEDLSSVLSGAPDTADASGVALMEEIAALFEKEQVYLDPAFDMDTLSQRLDVHRNQLSKTINLVYQKPFNTYINECRVRHAINLLSDPLNDSLSLETIAFDSGFASRTTFYRAFKAKVGINPATFRKNRG